MNEKHLVSETTEIVEDQPDLKYWPEIRDSFFLSQGNPGLQMAVMNVYAHLCPEKFQSIYKEWFEESEQGNERADSRIIKGLGAYVNHKQITLAPEIIRKNGTNWLMDALHLGNDPTTPIEGMGFLQVAKGMGKQDWKHLQVGRPRPNPSSEYSLRNSPNNSHLFHFAFIAAPKDYKPDSMMQVAVVSAAYWRQAIEDGTLEIANSVDKERLWEAYKSFMLHLTDYPEHRQLIPDDFLRKMKQLLEESK